MADPKRNDEIDDSIELYLSDLIELIKVQSNSGAVEAARAIRKKIKYGDSRAEQLRALQILELLVLNGGPSIGPIIARDDKLLDVLKGIINGTARTGVGVEYDRKVQKEWWLWLLVGRLNWMDWMVTNICNLCIRQFQEERGFLPVIWGIVIEMYMIMIVTKIRRMC